MRTIAVLPVKRLPFAKRRLGRALSAQDRRELAEAMLEDVLGALAAVEDLAEVLVVSADPDALARAAVLGFGAVREEADDGHSAAAARGIARATVLGAERVLLVPGDCPLLSARELTAMLASHDGAREVVVVPDRHGTGTNALLLAPPAVIAPAFGPGSRERHGRLARAAGVRARVARLPSLALDVDTADDVLAAWSAVARSTRGGRTRGVLERLAATARAAP